MDAKQQQQQVKKPQQQLGGDPQLGKENVVGGKDFGKDVKQQDLGMNKQQQGLGAGSGVNQGVGGKQQQGNIGGGSDPSSRQKISPGDDIPIKDSSRHAKRQGLGVGDKDALRQQEFPDAKQQQNLKNCSCCKRHFFADRVAKHEKACQQAHKKRSRFDTRAHRLSGLKEISLKQAAPAGKGAVAGKAAPRSSWRQQNEDFLHQIRSSKKGPRQQKFDAEVKVPARLQQRGLLGKEGQQRDAKQLKDVNQQGLDVQQQQQQQQKGGLAGQGMSRGEEAHLGDKKGKIASDSQQSSRQSYNQPTR
jgi:hypothetical protein